MGEALAFLSFSLKFLEQIFSKPKQKLRRFVDSEFSSTDEELCLERQSKEAGIKF